MATEDYQANSVVVPVFTGINDVPRVPTASEAGNGSDIIDRFNTLLGFLDTDIPALDTRLATAESTQSSQGSTISSLSTTQGNQQTTIDDHETRITTLESSGGGGSFGSTITLDTSNSSDWSNWFSIALDNLTLRVLHLPFGTSFDDNSNLAKDFGNLEDYVRGGIFEFSSLETASGDIDISTFYQGAGIYVLWITNQFPDAYGTSPGFPDNHTIPFKIGIDTNNSSGDFAVQTTLLDYVESNYLNNPWNSQIAPVEKDQLVIYSNNFDIRFTIGTT